MKRKPKRSYVVYYHRNKFNGKIYIGQTCQYPPERRWGKHGEGYKKNKKFYDDILLYGWDNFIHGYLGVGLTKQQANRLERIMIDKYNTVTFGYNNERGNK